MAETVATRPGGSQVPGSASRRPVTRRPITGQALALFLLRLPAFVPLIFVARGWLALNAKEVLTNTEADVLGTGGEICLLVALSITPLITVTGARWIAPLRRWYGIMFAVIGIADTITAAI